MQITIAGALARAATLAKGLARVNTLDNLGWREPFATSFAKVAERSSSLLPARVIAHHGALYRVALEKHEREASLAGKLRRLARDSGELPCVGDWVAVRDAQGKGVIHIEHVLTRATTISRREAGPRPQEQVLAANVDLVVLMMGLDGDFNPRRMERYVALARDSGAKPIVLLSKKDLARDLAAQRREVERVAEGIEVLAANLLEAQGHAELAARLVSRATMVLLGSSGVGKSTLINKLVGGAAQRVGAVRGEDSKGRHTTTHRELFVAKNGTLVIDTPGMRELQLWDAAAGLEQAFADVIGIAATCRFRDCKHLDEPGCGVRRAVQLGQLPHERLASYHKLQRELELLTAQSHTLSARARKQHDKSVNKLLRRRTKEKEGR